MNELMSHMEATIQANMLRYQCGQAIFCPGCQNILDCTRAVSADIYRGRDIVRVLLFCAKCFDEKKIAELIQGGIDKAAAKGITDGRVEYIDGRELHKAGLLGDGDEHGLPVDAD